MFRKVLSVALIATTMLSGGILLSEVASSESVGISVNAATANRSSCLMNCVQTGHKQYESKITINNTYKKIYVWRSGKVIKNMKTNNSKAIFISKDEQGRFFRTNSADDLGNYNVDIFYDDGTKDTVKIKFEAIKTNYKLEVGKSGNYNYTGGKYDVKIVKVISGKDCINAMKNGKNFKVTAKQEGVGKVKIIYTSGLVEVRTFNIFKNANNVNCELLYTYNQFMNMGVVNYQGKRFTYYSQSVLPGQGLNIPGRHVEGGYVSDGDGYIVLASPNLSTYPRYSTINTPFGRKGKFYDFCPGGSFDVYVQ